jgi:hypothetical protein
MWNKSLRDQTVARHGREALAAGHHVLFQHHPEARRGQTQRPAGKGHPSTRSVLSVGGYDTSDVGVNRFKHDAKYLQGVTMKPHRAVGSPLIRGPGVAVRRQALGDWLEHTVSPGPVVVRTADATQGRVARMVYQSSANHDPGGDSDRANITVLRSRSMPARFPGGRPCGAQGKADAYV